MIAVFKKELRDCLRWSPLGMVLGLVMLWMVLPDDITSATHMEPRLTSQLGLTASLIAIALGLLQSLPDTRNDSRGYLMHRPIEPSRIFWAKIAAGYATYVITLAVPVIVAMVYLQSIGIERLPTNALQVIPFLLYSCVAFLFHPTTLWIVSRDARWVGTRLLPAVSAIAFAYFVSMYFQFDGIDLLTLVTLIGIFCAFTCVAFLSARHAFVHQSQLPTRSSSNWFSWPCIIGLVASGAILYGVVFGFLASSIPQSPKDYVNHKLSLDDQGQWHQLETRRSRFNWSDVQFLTRDVDGKGEFENVDKDWTPAQSASLADFSSSASHQLEQFKALITIDSKTAASKLMTLVSHRDRLLLYDESKRLISITTPTGTSNTWEDSKGRFTGLKMYQMQTFNSDSRYNIRGNPLLADDNGLYQLIANDCRVERLTSNGGVDMVTLLLGEEDSPAAIWALAGDKLTQYEIEFEPSAEGFVIDWNYVKTEKKFSLPPIKKVHAPQSWQIEPLDRYESLRVARLPDGQHAIIRNNISTSVSNDKICVAYAMLKENGGVEQIGTTQLPELSGTSSDATIAMSMPPALIGSMLAIFSLFYSMPGAGSTGIIISTLCHGVLAAAATWWLSGRYQLSKHGRVTWAITGLLLGFGTLIGMVSIYRRHLKAECPRCSEDRRIDLESCELCGKLWDPPEQEGIEIFEHDRSLNQLETPSLS